MTTTELSRAPEREAEPSKAWRNKWRCVSPELFDDERDRQPGEYFWDWEVYPTKEVAEENAARDIREELQDFGLADIYLGAFPIEATP